MDLKATSGSLMPTLPRTLGEESFFFEWRGSRSPAHIAFSSFYAFKGLEFKASDVALSYAQVGPNTSVLLGDFPPDVWQRLPLSGHRVVKPADDVIYSLRRSMEYLECHHPDGSQLVAEYLPLICWTESTNRSNDENDTLITSCSLPTFPFASFLSEKALFHIPPKSLLKRPSIRCLAENIFHEAIHNGVNAMLIDEDVLIAKYDSRTSPKIAIPWRVDSIERNRAWELDRVIHASAVYVGISDFRLRELSRNELTSGERQCFTSALLQGLKSLAYLTEQMWGHIDWLGHAGRSLLVDVSADCAELRARAERIA